MPRENIVSVDLETTGLIPGTHQTWEVGVVPIDPDADRYHFQFQPYELHLAESQALQINHFYDRFDWIGDSRLARDMLTEGEPDSDGDPHKALCSATEAAFMLSKALAGKTIMGLNPHFDAAHLEVLLNSYGHAATWSHRHLDLGSFAAGAWGAKVPLSGKAVSDRYPQESELHNAFADASWNAEVYHHIITGQEIEAATDEVA